MIVYTLTPSFFLLRGLLIASSHEHRLSTATESCTACVAPRMPAAARRTAAQPERADINEVLTAALVPYPKYVSLTRALRSRLLYASRRLPK